MDNQLTEMSCRIIAAVGEAKGLYIEAIKSAKIKDIDQAIAKIEEGDRCYAQGHSIHKELLTKFASGEKIEVDILLVHAECQMMSAEDFQLIAKEVVEW